ncbi:hypothetical protein [Proteiniphilum sp. X52]|uniref:hypothetical protein n=1 Tax=Proteiniphilum sp. X52 TaxID=2382159 RepID=UPI0021014F67|nr:hypothetical protein [Proteiniphilum sp. X52]
MILEVRVLSGGSETGGLDDWADWVDRGDWGGTDCAYRPLPPCLKRGNGHIKQYAHRRMSIRTPYGHREKKGEIAVWIRKDM